MSWRREPLGPLSDFFFFLTIEEELKNAYVMDVLLKGVLSASCLALSHSCLSPSSPVFL